MANKVAKWKVEHKMKPMSWKNKPMKSEIARFKRDASIKGKPRNILKEF